MPLTPDDFNYALENTRVVLGPRNRLSTFGTSIINYHLVTEDMDTANLSRVREGRIHAEKPQILSPHHIARLMLEGFGDKAREFADSVSANAAQFAFLKYGFRFRKDELRTYDVHEQIETVIESVTHRVTETDDPLSAVITGVDDGWEVCLIKFMIDLIQNSAGGNLDDFRQQGML